jgi:ABC-type uncharacterized transport system substrate-binding protein
MRRREFVALVGSVAGWPFAASAQQMLRVGILMNIAASDPEARSRVAALQQRLQELGWAEGRNIKIVVKYPSDQIDDLHHPAAELVASNVDIVVTAGTPAAQAVQKLTKSIPVVMGAVGDPIGAGLVASLARPGGNMTGFSLESTEVVTKRLNLTKELLPSATRVAFLWNPNNASIALQFKETKAVANTIGVHVQSIEAATLADIDSGMLAAAKGRADAVFATSDALQTANRAHIAALAIQYKLPLTGEFKILADAGALFTYGPLVADLWRRAGDYVDKILRGEKPADLPIQQPTKFELTINLKTAKELGLPVPASLLARADEVIE